ncbi:MAG TPA: adenylyltransferase/cytidyltransferase family protein [Verrucomicrobiae bacterium]|nr:adenylyltransferase/cytidyltransferase family protein [Verrucomicrobiae bacterium]
MKVVLTSGSYDIIHEGHQDYLEAAKALGDFLVVGLDSDAKIRQRKQKSEYDLRPFFSQNVRVRQLAGQRPVDVITLKDVDQEKWALIKVVKPHVLQATKETYSPEELEALKEFCGEVVVQEPFATQGTSEHMRRMMRGGAQEFRDSLLQTLPESVSNDVRDALTRRIPEIIEDVLGRLHATSAQGGG